MKTIEKYVFGSFLSSFLLAFLVLSFVLTIALLVQIVGFILDGVSAKLIGQFALVSFPETLQWTVPLALLVASVLVFSRLSADGEIAAMRACGINLIAVMKWPVLFALLCSLLGAYVNNEVVPRGHEVRRNLKNKVSVGTGIDILEPGMWIDDFPKVKIYFGAKEGNWLRDLLVLDYSNPKFDRTIRAAKALVTSEGDDVSLDLYGMSVDPLDADHPGVMHVNRYLYVMKDVLEHDTYTKKVKDFRFFESLEKAAELKDRSKHAGADDDDGRRLRREMKRSLSKLKVEISKRLVFAVASLCFVLVGIPLGIRAQRKESSIGMAISLAISLGYYLVVMLMLSMQKNYAIHPEYLIWLPVLACFALAARFVKKNL